jgi:futalosine hydrolase
MHILLASATTFEIQPTIDYLGEKTTVTPLITGVGSLAATWALMRRIRESKPDIIIQAGIAGCLDGRRTGEVVAVREEIQADLGVWEDDRFKTLFDLKLAEPDEFPYSGARLTNPHERLLALSGVDPVTAITVNEITTDPVRIKWYQQNTGAVVESMEGAALHYVGLQEKIPFIQLRAISNDIGVRDKTKWDIRGAITNLNEQTIALVGRLKKTNLSALEL